MSYILFNKIRYVFYSPIVWIWLKIKGVKCSGNSLWCGFPFISKTKGSTIVIGSACRFASKKTANLLGINHRCMISTYNKKSTLSIGDNCGFSGVTIWCFDKISIGNHVRVGANVTIMDGDAHQNDPRAGKDKPVTIEDNVWIGANVIVLKGATIGRNSLIGAGSVVSGNIPANVIAAGNPCKVVRQLDENTIKEIEKL